MVKSNEDIEKYRTKPRIGEYNPDNYNVPNRDNVSDANNDNPWIAFAKQWAEDHNMTMGCAIRDRNARLEYNTKYKIKKSIKNAPKQLQAWLRHSKAAAKQNNNCMSCQFTNKSNQKNYKEGEHATEPRKSPAKISSIEETLDKLNRLIEEYKLVNSGQAKGNLKSIDANIIATRILLDEKEREYQKHPKGHDSVDDDENQGRYEGIGAKEPKPHKLFRTAPELDKLQTNLKDLEDELDETVNAYKYNADRFSENKLLRIKNRATELKKQITQVKNILYHNNIMQKPIRKARAKKGGSLMTVETARLGHPERIQETGLRQASSIPVPPSTYYNPFTSVATEPKPSKKLSGYGRISDKRQTTAFKADSVAFPM